MAFFSFSNGFVRVVVGMMEGVRKTAITNITSWKKRIAEQTDVGGSRLFNCLCIAQIVVRSGHFRTIFSFASERPHIKATLLKSTAIEAAAWLDTSSNR